ncbi:LysM peptidoglycan-binding domain-containing protein [Enterococcus faecium]
MAKPSTPATYKVKAGDSVWGICEKYGLSISKFVQWNKIKNNTIHPGQKLTVKQPVSSGKPTTKVPASTNPVTHKVSYGESLWLISSKYGVTVDELRKQNGIKGDLIHPGQVLVVKKGMTTSHSTPAGKSGTSYTVKAGDSVWLIANRYDVSMDDLVKWNKIKNYTIHPGQVLTIQTIVSTPAKPAITTTPKVKAKPAITTTPKAESKSGVTTTPKVDEKPVITTIPKVKEQPVVTTVPKTESEVLVEKASGDGSRLDINIKNFEIKNKHLNSSTAKRARKFNVSSAEEANKIVQDALKNGKLVEAIPNGVGSQGQNSFSSIIDTGKVIGTKGETHIKIVYDELKNVWTTYPVPKP